MNTEEQYNRAVIMASGQYLTDYLPENFYEMNDDELEEYVEAHIWEGVENLPAEEVIAQISQTADMLIRFHNQEQS